MKSWLQVKLFLVLVESVVTFVQTFSFEKIVYFDDLIVHIARNGSERR